MFDLNAYSLHKLDPNGRITRILNAALHAVDPYQAVLNNMRREGNRLNISGVEYDLDAHCRVLVLGCGKAGAPMAAAARQVLGERLSSGLVIVKDGHRGEWVTSPVQVLESAHPVPDLRSVQATEQLLEIADSAGEDDLVLFMISGGGSALMTSPVEEVSLDDLQALTGMLLASGATINEINTLRKHLDKVKGGRLTQRAAPAEVLTLILSDVIGDPPDVIASGPTVPDATTFPDTWKVLEQYNLLEKVPAAVRHYLRAGLSGEVPETPKPGDPLFKRLQTVVVGNNTSAAQAALAQAKQEGFHTLLLTTALQGEARHAGRFLASIARQVRKSGEPLPSPACIIAGGETTVTLQGDGRGGRNQEMALGAVDELAGLENTALVCLATDGGDGPTDAAGAVATGETFLRARHAGLNSTEHLNRNDAYPYFNALRDLLKPGPTFTNVNDLAFLFLL